MILTASEFIELGEKYGYKIKYFDDGYYWLMPGESSHFIAQYQKCLDQTHYIQVARDFEYDEEVERYRAQRTVMLKNDLDFETEIVETIKQYKEGIVKYKKEVIENDFKPVRRNNGRI